MIDLSSLRRALATLDEALAALARAPEDKFIRDARNATSRAYNEDRALAVIAKLPGFAKAAVFLATQIEARQS